MYGGVIHGVLVLRFTVPLFRNVRAPERLTKGNMATYSEEDLGQTPQQLIKTWFG